MSQLCRQVTSVLLQKNYVGNAEDSHFDIKVE